MVNKPARLLTVATEKEKEKTLFHKVLEYEKKKHKSNKVFIVHRLDYDTSGVVIFAVYDGNDLIGCSIKNVNTPGEKITSDEITVKTADDGVAVYAFLWDGMESIKPLTDSFAY